jgi:hypothetical protein
MSAMRTASPHSLALRALSSRRVRHLDAFEDHLAEAEERLPRCAGGGRLLANSAQVEARRPKRGDRAVEVG